MALDYNPDKENWAGKKRWMVVKAVKDPNWKSIVIDGKEMKFGRDGAFRVNDPGIAEAIRKEVGNRATVTRFRNPDPVSDRGHRYFFGQMPAMPWHRYDEFGRRIYDGEEEVDTEGDQETGRAA